MLFVFGGKITSNLLKVQSLLNGKKLRYKVLSLCYDLGSMQQAGYFTRMRGVANCGSSESLLLCWKAGSFTIMSRVPYHTIVIHGSVLLSDLQGKMPKTFPKHRQFVDAGSPLYTSVMHNVPVATAEELCHCHA